MADNHASFVGSIPDNYDRCLGPLFFRPHAAAMARFLPALKRGRILELACGTGILTRVLRDELPVGVEIIATDLNEAMIDHAREKFDASDRVVMLPADATTLPFPSNSFDAVFCQFGFMFFPDKPAAFH